MCHTSVLVLPPHCCECGLGMETFRYVYMLKERTRFPLNSLPGVSTEQKFIACRLLSDDNSSKSQENLAALQSSAQREISQRIDAHNLQNFLTHTRDSDSVRDVARLNSLGLPNSGAWLNVQPSPSLGLHLKPAAFVVSLKY